MSDAKRFNDKPALGGDAPLASDLLGQYRRILDAIHAGGNIYYDTGRFAAYKIIALKASELRQRQERARAMLEGLRESYSKLSPAHQVATKQALLDH